MKEYVKTRPYRPSNGTEGDMFSASFCDLCARDAEARKAEPDFSKACKIRTATFAHDREDAAYPAEWIEDADDAFPGETARCTAYVPDGEAFAAEARRFIARDNRKKGVV